MRHALTKYNLQNRLAGREDVPLCDQGFQEIETNRALIMSAVSKADTVLCSTLLRCRQTCEALGIEKRTIFSEGLIEKDFGTATGKKRQEVARDKNGNVIEANVEAFDMIERRAVAVIKQFVKNGSVFVVSHGGVFTALNQTCTKPLSGKTKNAIPYRFVNYGTSQSHCVLFHS